MKDERRTFTEAQRRDLFVASGGLCRDCGCDITDAESTWEAHHEAPHSSGGATEHENGIALCRECHRKRHRAHDKEMYGGFVKDYSWQDSAIERFISGMAEFYASGPGEFDRAYVLEVSPSAGKTVFALKLASTMIDADQIDKVVLVVPRDNIKDGVVDDTRRVIINNCAKRLLNSKYIRIDSDIRNYRSILKNYHGIVITYQSLQSVMDWLALLSGKYRLLIVFDEAHHGASGDSDEATNEWGAAMQKCRAVANAAVLMTGTPIRADDRRIPYVRYDDVQADDGRSGYEVRADYKFGYAAAVTAGVARKLVCRSHDVVVTYEETTADGEIVEASAPVSCLPRAKADRLKNLAFCGNRGTLDYMLREAHNEVERLRRMGDGRAAVLVVARRDSDEDTKTLQSVADRIEALFGERAVTVESADGPSARDTIRAFKRGDGKWIVAKEMISEGTNIPRLRVVLILRDIGNRTFYEQLVHRVTRNAADDRPEDAIIIQLKLPHLHAWGEDLERQAQIGWLKQKRRVAPDPSGEPRHPPPAVDGICAEPGTEAVNIGGIDFSDSDPRARDMVEALVHTRITRFQANEAIRFLGAVPPASAMHDDEIRSIEDDFKAIYEAARKRVNAAAINMGGQKELYGKVMAECKRSAGIKGNIPDILRDHPKPLEAIRAFYRAAGVALNNSVKYRRKPPRGDASGQEALI